MPSGTWLYLAARVRSTHLCSNVSLAEGSWKDSDICKNRRFTNDTLRGAKYNFKWYKSHLQRLISTGILYSRLCNYRYLIYRIGGWINPIYLRCSYVLNYRYLLLFSETTYRISKSGRHIRMNLGLLMSSFPAILRNASFFAEWILRSLSALYHHVPQHKLVCADVILICFTILCFWKWRVRVWSRKYPKVQWF